MRLGQLSRKVNVSQKEIVSFLKKERGIELKVHPNVKVEDELTDLVVDAFESKPEATVEEKQEVEALEETKPKAETPEPTSNSEAEVTEVEDSTEEKPTEIKEYLSGEEFIRPDGPIEKVETEIPQLDGLKVVGKIDLPEFHKEAPAPDKPADESTNTDSSDAEAKEEVEALPNATPLFKRPKRRKPKTTEKKVKGNSKKTLSEEDRKRKELERAEKERLAIKKARKEAARKKHLELVESYQKAGKPNKVRKQKSNQKNEHKVESPSTHQKPTKQPKTIIGKIWRWMNTE